MSTDRLDRIEAIVEANSRGLAELRLTSDTLLRIVEQHQANHEVAQRNFELIWSEIRSMTAEIRSMTADIRSMTADIKGLQTENRRILDRLFGDDQNTQSGD